MGALIDEISKTVKKNNINLLQKQTVRFVFNEDRLSHSRPLLRKINELNVY